MAGNSSIYAVVPRRIGRGGGADCEFRVEVEEIEDDEEGNVEEGGEVVI